MSHAPSVLEPGIYRLIIELPPTCPDNSNITVTSGPHQCKFDVGFMMAAIVDGLRIIKLIKSVEDLKIRIIEQGGESQSWTRNRFGEYVQDMPGQLVKRDIQQGGGA